jgi:hypothetical protein
MNVSAADLIRPNPTASGPPAAAYESRAIAFTHDNALLKVEYTSTN